MNKTRRMIEAEKRLGRPLEDVLLESLNEKGFKGASKLLGVSSGCLSYWMLKLGIEHRYVLRADEEAYHASHGR